MMTYGFLNPDAVDSSIPSQKLLDTVIQTIGRCWDIKEGNDIVQVQIVKALSHAATTKSCNLTGSNLMLVVRTVYNIHLMSRSKALSQTSQTNLTQMLNVIFGRMEGLIVRPSLTFQSARRTMTSRKTEKRPAPQAAPQPQPQPPASPKPKAQAPEESTDDGKESTAERDAREAAELEALEKSDPEAARILRLRIGRRKRAEKTKTPDEEVPAEQSTESAQEDRQGISSDLSAGSGKETPPTKEEEKEREEVEKIDAAMEEDEEIADAAEVIEGPEADSIQIFRTLCKLSLKPADKEIEMKSKLLSLDLLLDVLEVRVGLSPELGADLPRFSGLHSEGHSSIFDAFAADQRCLFRPTGLPKDTENFLGHHYTVPRLSEEGERCPLRTLPQDS